MNENLKEREQLPMGQFKVGFSFFGCGDCFLFEEVPDKIVPTKHSQSGRSRVTQPEQVIRRKFDQAYANAYTGYDQVNDDAPMRKPKGTSKGASHRTTRATKQL